MPNDLRVQAAHAYMAHPNIHIGYNFNKGGVGTVRAITNEHPIDITQADTSIMNLSFQL
jgi:hypothetical protein